MRIFLHLLTNTILPFKPPFKAVALGCRSKGLADSFYIITKEVNNLLSEEEIKKIIENDIQSEKKQLARVARRYYDGKHDILNNRFFYFNKDEQLVEDKARANIKIAHPYFRELCDQLAGYILSFKEKPIQAKEKVKGLQKHLDLYFDNDFWAEFLELITGTVVDGEGYLYAYQNEENRLAFEYAEGLGVALVREKESSDKCKHIIYYYIDRINNNSQPIIKIQDWTESEVYYYTQLGTAGKLELDTDMPLNPRPHVVYADERAGKLMGYPLGYIPFFPLYNNNKHTSDLRLIKSHIDDYDLHACSLSNNLVDFDMPLYVVSGFEGESLDQLTTNLKVKKAIGVDTDGDVTIRTLQIPYEARKAKLELDEKAIYHFGFGFNTAGLKDTTATTNLAILTAYEGINLRTNKLLPRINKLIKSLLKPIIAEINEKNGTNYSVSDVEIKFKPVTMTNETENAAIEKVKAETEQIKVNTILDVAASVGDETALKQICEVMDWDFNEIQNALLAAETRNDLEAAKLSLNEIIPDDMDTEE